MRRIMRSLGTLVIMVVLYQVYAWLAVPWLEPSVQAGVSSGEIGPGMPEQQDNTLARLFPAGAWELDSAKILKTNRGIVLFQDYHPTDDGRVELKPLTLIFFPDDKEPDRKDGSGNSPREQRRPVIIQAPAGATLQLDKPLDLQSKPGELTGGRLAGPVTITSPPSRSGANDRLFLKTRDIQLDNQRIWTPHQVAFQYGPHYGRGRDLVVLLTDPQDQPTQNQFAARSLELVHVDVVHLEMEESNSFLGGKSDTRSPTAAGQSVSLATRNSAAPDAKPPTPVEIRCTGPFEFDFVANRASFEENVVVQRIHPAGLRDQLDAALLAVQFARPHADGTKNNGTKNNDTADRGTDAGGTAALEVQYVDAVGQPVILNAPSMESFAQAARLHFDLQTRHVHAQDDRRVVLRHRRHYVEAGQLEYELTEDPKRIGRLWAQGPGLFRTSDVGKRQDVVTATWRHELQIRPDRGDHVVSLKGEASVNSQATGGAQADQIHLWIHEQPHPEKAGKFVIQPRRMLAQDNVRINSPQLSGATRRMEVWIRQEDPIARIASLPAGADDANAATTSGAGTSGQRTGNASRGQGLLASNEKENGRPPRKFDITGELIRIQAVQAGNQVLLDEVSVNGNVLLKEILVATPHVPPTEVQGASIWVKNTRDNRATVTVQGARDSVARIVAEGVTLVGPAIRMSQVDNTVTINGPGEMIVPPGVRPRKTGDFSSDVRNRVTSDVTNRRTIGGKGSSYRIRWQGSMAFDGRRAHFERDVRVDGRHFLKSGSAANVTATGTVLDADLDRRIDFANPKSSGDVSLWQLTYSGEFHAINHGVGPAGAKESTDQIHAFNLNINQSTGRLHADGPGWASTTRFSRDPLADEPATVPALRDKPPQLIYSHIQFAKEIEGNIHQRQMEFRERIRLVYGPIANWEQTLDADRRETWGTDGFLLTSDRLAAAEMGPRMKKDDIPIELEATGDVVVENLAYTARAARIAYTKAKELMLLEGDGRNEARIWLSNKTTPDAIARRILFWRKTQRFEIGWGQYFDFSRFGAAPQNGTPSSGGVLRR